MHEPLTQARLKELLHYNRRTGVFRWRVTRGGCARAGSVAGCTRSDGYVQIRVDGEMCLAHRLAWLYVYGEWPPDVIDHINWVTADNRICNLRAVTALENARHRQHPAEPRMPRAPRTKRAEKARQIMRALMGDAYVPYMSRAERKAMLEA